MALPTIKSKVKSLDPQNLIIFSNPKAGKSSSLAQLPNTLILDLEDGYKYLGGCYVQPIKSVQDLYDTAKALRTEQHNFKFVAIDTVTKLEDLALTLAKKLYQETPMGRNFEGDNVLKLPNGAGLQNGPFSVNCGKPLRASLTAHTSNRYGSRYGNAYWIVKSVKIGKPIKRSQASNSESQKKVQRLFPAGKYTIFKWKCRNFITFVIFGMIFVDISNKYLNKITYEI